VKDDKLVPIGHGSGVVVSAEGLIVTNFHVVNGGSRYFVEFEPSTQGTAAPQFECELFKSAPEPDLAVLKMKLQKPAEAGLTALPLGRSADLRVGDTVCAIGAPFSAELINNVSFGTVSALARTERKYIVHTAATYAGSSGGPLLSMKGEIVGIHAAGLTGEVRTPAGETAGQAFMPGFGLAIPAELVAELLK
jgi:S1-C subfamily serine protease